MYMQVVSIEHSLERPRAELGDVVLSPILHRVSARCPVLHLFGYVSIPLAHASAEPATAEVAASVESRHVNFSSPEGQLGGEPGTKVFLNADACTRGDGRRNAQCGDSVAPLASRIGSTCGIVRQNVASPSPRKSMHALGHEGHYSITSTAEATAQPGDSASSSFLFSRTSHADHLAAGGEGPPSTITRRTTRSSTAWRGSYTQRRACLHVHGVYPSLLLPQYDRNVSADQLAAQLETVVLRVLARQGTVVPSQQVVHDARLVRRINVYGYHPRAHIFYEVELIDPELLTRVADILQNSSEVGGRRWQLYNAHYGYHTQFMVRWRVQGVAPFILPTRQCHLRLPTVAELSEGRDVLSASLASLGDAQASCHASRGGDDIVGRELKNEEGDGKQSVFMPAMHSQWRFTRRWRPDELGRFTTAEVELDVSGDDLLRQIVATAKGEASDAEARIRGTRSIVEAADNLSHTRRSIRIYFKECGVADALRVADTITMECQQRAREHLSVAFPREPCSPPTYTTENKIVSEWEEKQLHQQRRYGCVMQIQRSDPTVRWLQHRMLAYMLVRLEADSVVAASHAALATGDGGEASPSKYLTKAGGASSSALPVASNGSFLGSAAQFPEQHAIRQRLIAEYRKPGYSTGTVSGRGRHHGDTGTRAPRVHKDGCAVISPVLARVPELGVPLTGVDPLYVGCSSESVQLSSPQGHTPLPQLHLVAAMESTVHQTIPSSSQVTPLGRLSPTIRADAVAAPTQDLFAALAHRSTLLLSSEVNPRALSVAEADTPATRRTSVGGQELDEKHYGDLQGECETKADLVGGTAPTSAAAALAVPTATTRSRRESSFSWSSCLSAPSSPSPSPSPSFTAIPSHAQASPHHGTDCRDADESGDGPCLHFVVPQAREGVQEKRCRAPSASAAVMRTETTQLLTRPSFSGSGRGRIAGKDESSFNALSDAEAEATRPSAAFSQEEGSLLPLESSDGDAAPDELAGAEVDCTPESGRRCASSLSAACPISGLSITRPSFASPCGFAEGDCVAFVRVRAVSSGHLGEVLAVARIAAFLSGEVELQWLLRLSETHLAADERALVRRGSWLRAWLPSVERVTNTVNSTTHCHIHTAGDALDAHLGEMLLGNVVDRVLISTLEVGMHTAMMYAAELSTLQHLSTEMDAVPTSPAVDISGIGLAAHETQHTVSSGSRQSGCRGLRDEAVREVQVWRVHCFRDAVAYWSGARPADEPRWLPTGHSRSNHLPTLRVLCRYSYNVEALLLTDISPGAFTQCVRVPPVEDGSEPPSRHCLLRCQKKMGTGKRAAEATMACPPSQGRTSSCRVLYSQPQPLPPLGNSPLHSRRSAAAHQSALVPSFRPSASLGKSNTLPENELSDEGGEDRLLFSSDSVSIGSSSWESRGPSQRRDDATMASVKRSSSQNPATRLHCTALEGPPGGRDVPLLSSEAGERPPYTADSLQQPVVRSFCRVVLARMPPADVYIGGIRVPRSVKVFDRIEAYTLMSQGQTRPHQHVASYTAHGNDVSTIDAAAAAASEALNARRPSHFVSVTGGIDCDGEEDQSVDATVGNESCTDASRIKVTAAGAWGQEVEGVGVTSLDSYSEDRESAVPLTSFTVSSSACSQSSSLSVSAVREVTASQRAFLELLKPERNLLAGNVHPVLLQLQGQLGCIADGMPRSFLVSATGRDGVLRSGRVSGELRVYVSAVAWPWYASPGALCNDGALVPHRYERLPSHSTASAHFAGVPHGANSASTAAFAGSTVRDAEHHPQVKIKSHRSAGRVSGLSLCSTEHPHLHLQCTLRVLYIEVLLDRRPGEVLASSSRLLAVGLGQATSDAKSGIAIRLFCLAAADKSFDACAGPCSTAGSCALGSPPLADGGAPPLAGLTEAVQVLSVPDEAALLSRIRDEILAYDPDVLISWDGVKYGLGYLALRYWSVLQRDLALDLSRVLQHHGPQRPCSNIISGSRAAPLDASGDPGGKTDVAACCSSSVPQDRSAETLGAQAQVSGHSRAGCLSPPPASRAVLSVTAGHKDCRTAAARVGVHGVAATAARPPPPSTTSLCASSAALIVDADQDDDDSDEKEDTEASECSKGDRRCGSRATSTRQESQHVPDGVTPLAHRGLRWSRRPPKSPTVPSQYTKQFGANVRVAGRVCTSLGKDIRKDLKMPSYSLPMVHVELLGQPLPYFTDSYLTELFLSSRCPDAPSGGERHTALRYLASRVAAPHRIACKLRWFTKLLEFSQMYGILTHDVLTRGSQFRVEATLLRLAEPLGYAMLSPSLSQVHRQPRIECIPLVMQPKVDLYRHDPVVVLDFRSLYPSIIIAYNLCYSTCLGVVQPHARGRLGVLPRFKQSDATLVELLPDDGVQHSGVVFTPNGAMFVPPSTRVGLLPQMMQAVLDARFEVQAALKHIAVPSEDILMVQRLEEQQLALKMLANVTYGYTAASYTGRMPCVDLAEAIVSLGRQTLERAVALIHSTPAWRAEVVYGDTDSLFVRLAGRTKAEAFRIGQEMADAVTHSNPVPMRLQLEKVLLPCLLLTKKRYAGYMWCTPTQATPMFLAKGIEVVRRDQCPATAQLACQLLRQMFDGAGVAALKQHYLTAVERLQTGTVNPIQCIFRRAVKLDRYRNSDDAHLPLAARSALQQMEKDAMQTPYWGERLPYVVVQSTASLKKISSRVLHPECLLYVHDTTHSLDATYYIVRHINSTLDRMFYVIGISFSRWYQTMPRRRSAYASLIKRTAFMEAQQRQGVRPMDAGGAAPSSCLLDVANTVLSPQSRGVRLGKLTTLMRGLLHHSSVLGLLSAFSRGDASAPTMTMTTAIAPEEISDGDDEENKAMKPSEAEDLDRPSKQEVFDVEQLVTQRSHHASSFLRESVSPSPDNLLRRGQVVSRSGRQKRWRTVTIDSFYPRTLCVVCEEETVGLDDLSRHGAVFMQVGVSGFEAAAGASSLSSSATSCASTASKACTSQPFLLPPVCTRCWSDPLLLHLRVQQQCCSLSRQMNALQRLCGRCISSGGGASSVAADEYKQAIADMEDMSDFRMSSTLVPFRKVPGNACDGVDGSTPRHILTAVELSADGVPRGCVSVDCAIGFEKKWVTSQWMQWQALQTFLSRVS